jgi:ADP-heptose:LPS heptosyltransferase
VSVASGALFRLYDADRFLARARRRGTRRFATAWIRGLGDVAYIVGEFVRHVGRVVPGAELTLLVRPGLGEACRWIEGVHRVVEIAEWRREQTLSSPWGLAFPPPWEIRRALARHGLAVDMILPYPLGRWYDRDFTARRPALTWTAAEREFGRRFLDRAFPGRPRYVVALNTHIGTSRYYEFDKEWGASRFAALMMALLDDMPDSRLVLVDATPAPGLPTGPRVLDARGRLSVGESVSVAAAADLFVGLDAGVVNLVHYLRGVSLDIVVVLGRTSCFAPLIWPAPSADVRLTAVVGDGGDIRTVTPDRVLAAVRAARERRAEAVRS